MRLQPAIFVVSHEGPALRLTRRPRGLAALAGAAGPALAAVLEFAMLVVSHEGPALRLTRRPRGLAALARAAGPALAALLEFATHKDPGILFGASRLDANEFLARSILS